MTDIANARIRGENVPANYEFQGARKDGSKIWLQNSARAVDWGGDRAIQSVVVDITERKAVEAERAGLEAQLRESQKMEAVGTLAGGIAHDFNNILAGMTGYAHLAIDAVPAKSQLRGDLEQVLKSIDRATSLVKQILAFSRRSEAECHAVEIGRVVEETLDLLRASISSTIEIHRKIDREAGTVMADATQLQQIVMNLCTNAADAIGQGSGVIEVALTRVELGAADTATRPDLAPGSYVKLSVSDSGAGMDAATRARVFEPFFTTKEPGKGTGLGLAVAHGILREHGGAIEVDSAPGRGTTLTVLLPRAEAVERGVARADREIPRGHEQILLVDDEAAIVHSEKRLLERLGYKVEAVTSSFGALEAFRAAPEEFDLVITDQAMPKLPGMALAQEILKLRGDTPIILCSGFSEVAGAEDAMAAGIREFMTKPIRPDDLARAVRRALDGDV
jgi:signal transduction histidine kinase/CheY-like chemotaxis protein